MEKEQVWLLLHCDMWGPVTEVGENEPGFCCFVHQNPPNNPKCQQRANGDKSDVASWGNPARDITLQWQNQKLVYI